MEQTLEQIICYKTKPELNKYTLEELKEIIVKDDKKRFNKILDLINETVTETETEINSLKKNIINEIYELWKNNPINNSEDLNECMFCFSQITNSDNMIMKCEHQSHSSCFFKYLYTNFNSILLDKNDYDIKEKKINNIFRCPKCRKDLIDILSDNFNHIADYHEDNTNYQENPSNLNFNTSNIVIIENNSTSGNNFTTDDINYNGIDVLENNFFNRFTNNDEILCHDNYDVSNQIERLLNLSYIDITNNNDSYIDSDNSSDNGFDIFGY